MTDVIKSQTWDTPGEGPSDQISDAGLEAMMTAMRGLGYDPKQCQFLVMVALPVDLPQGNASTSGQVGEGGAADLLTFGIEMLIPIARHLNVGIAVEPLEGGEHE